MTDTTTTTPEMMTTAQKVNYIVKAFAEGRITFSVAFKGLRDDCNITSGMAVAILKNEASK